MGQDIADYFDLVYRKAIELNALDSELQGLPKGEDRSKNIQCQREIKDWLNSQYKVVDEKFNQLLTLRH